MGLQCGPSYNFWWTLMQSGSLISAGLGSAFRNELNSARVSVALKPSATWTLLRKQLYIYRTKNATRNSEMSLDLSARSADSWAGSAVFPHSSTMSGGGSAGGGIGGCWKGFGGGPAVTKAFVKAIPTLAGTSAESSMAKRIQWIRVISGYNSAQTGQKNIRYIIYIYRNKYILYMRVSHAWEGTFLL